MLRKLNAIKPAVSILIALAFLATFSGTSFAQDEKDVRKQFKKHIKQGKGYLRKKMYEEAIEEYKKALALKPQSAFTRSLIKKTERHYVKEILKNAKRNYRKRLYENAITKCEKALIIDPKNKAAKKVIEKSKARLEKKSKTEEKKQTKTSRGGAYTLEECIDIAMKNSTSLEIAKGQLKIAKSKLLEAIRKLAPSVTARYEESTGTVDEKDYEGQKIIIEGRQPLFYGGELIFSIKQARVNLEIVKRDYDRVKNELVLQVKKAYFNLDKAKKTLKIQEKLRKNTKGLYDIAKTGYEANVIAQVEFLKLSSQYNQAKFQVVSAEEDLYLANLILQQAMNIDEEIEIVEVKKPLIIEIDLEDCLELAYLNRPELKISMLSLEFLNYEKKITRARSDWPRVDFVGSYGNTREDFVSKELAAGIEPRDLGPEYYLGAKVSVPFWGNTFGYAFSKEEWQPVVSTTHGTEAQTHSATFAILDKLSDITKAKETQLEYLRSKDELTKARQEAALDIKERFFEYRKARILMEVAKSKVEFQAKQVEVLNIKQSLGEALASDVVEEMIKLAEEEFSYTQAIADYYIAIASLNKAIGINDYFKVR